MNEIKLIHRQAMELLDEADAASRQGNLEIAKELRISAFKKESEAARLTYPDIDLEPTRSVLHQSAANLALLIGNEKDAIRLLHAALAGNPDEVIRREIEATLDDLDYRRHLQIRGIELTNDEIQLSLAGEGIGYGVAPTDEVVSRIESTTLLLARTAERILRLPYRASGRRSEIVKDLITPMLSTPRAASFAITFKIGRSQQTAFEGLGRTEQIIDEFLECMNLFAAQDESALRERIPEPDYYRNFLALSTAISPDGEVVNLVGFTATRNREEHMVAIKRDRPSAEQMLLHSSVEDSPMLKNPRSQHMEVSGLLRYADALKDNPSIKLKAGKKTFNIVVPSGIDDIVRPLWGRWVSISGEGVGKKIELHSIRAVDPPASKD